MLLLLLLMSSGCDVNIPGCGRRSLPFFKKVTPPSTPVSQPVAPPAPAPKAVPPAANPVHAVPETSIQIKVSHAKPKPAVPFTPTPTATPVPVEKIAYTTLEKGKPTLWTMNTDGTGATRLTVVGTSSWFPLWSPNGKKLAFLSDMIDGKINLFVHDKDGNGFTQLTFFPDLKIPDPNALRPPFSWSPKSDEIAFIYRNQVWKVSLNSTFQTTLASKNPAYSVSAIEWAPHRDNRYVAFLVAQGGGYDALKLVNPRLRDQLELAHSTAEPLKCVSWSSDARKVAYLSGRHTLYTASPDASTSKVLLSSQVLDLDLVSYSPSENGSTLMLLAKQDSDPSYRVALLEKPSKDDKDPGTVKFLTGPGVVNAVWSPDGSKIAYVTENGDLWVMDSNGTKKTRISISVIQSPDWSQK